MGVDGILCTLGEVHKRCNIFARSLRGRIRLTSCNSQRKVLSPAFTTSAVKSYMAAFFESAEKVSSHIDQTHALDLYMCV